MCSLKQFSVVAIELPWTPGNTVRPEMLSEFARKTGMSYNEPVIFEIFFLFLKAKAVSDCTQAFYCSW